MNLGDLHWVELPGGAGRAQAGRRPAIIVQTDSVSARLPTLLLIPLTTQQDELRFPGTVLIEPDTFNLLPRISIALAFQLTVIDKRFVGPRLGRVSSRTLDAIWSALDEVTGRSGRT